MNNETLIPKASLSGIFYSLASLIIITIGLMHFDSIFKPLSIAFLIWFMIMQVKVLLGKIHISGKRIPSSLRGILAFMIIFSTLVFITGILIENLEELIMTMPNYISNFDKISNDVTEIVKNPVYSDYIQKLLSSIDLHGIAVGLLNSITGIVSNSAIVIVYVIFFLLEEASTNTKFEKLFPEKGQKYKSFLFNISSINKSIRSYINSKTSISLITAAVSYIALVLLDVDYALLWSFLIFIMNFIPYIGPLISSLLPAIFAGIVVGDFYQFIYVFAALEVIQIILGNFVEPMMMGKGTNLGPITVIIALAFWGMIWGMVGMMLAVPVTSVLVIVLSQIPSTRYIAILLSEKGNIPDIVNQN